MIGMIDRRRAANVNNPNVDYIQNGLVFHLDCADYDSALNTWIDKIGNVSFAMSDVTVDSLGGVVFNGTASSKGIASVGLNNPVDSSTIEVAIKVNTEKTQFIIDSGVANTIAYGFLNSTNQGLCSITTRKNFNIVGFTGFIANSVHYGNDPLHVLNGNIGTFSSTGNFWGKNGDTACIGIRGNNLLQTAFDGTIYQIRIYNRLLSSEEMMHNQQIDMRKYNSN